MEKRQSFQLDDREAAARSASGAQIRNGYLQIVLNGGFAFETGAILAHETLHMTLSHLPMLLWIEEGLAQMFEHDMVERNVILIDEEMASERKRFWKKHTLNDFWHGEGFFKAGKMQNLSYQLAEILTRLLIEEHRPRWFGFVKEPQRRFFAFLRNAEIRDCGSESAKAHLGMSLSDIASRFLGPGEWEPSL